MTIIHWTFAGLGALIFMFHAATNARYMVEGILKPEKNRIKPELFTGGIAGVIALINAPVGGIFQRLHYAWLPLLLDVGCGLLPVYLVVCSIIEYRKDSVTRSIRSAE